MQQKLSKKEQNDLIYESLVGSKITITNSKNKNQIGVSGTLVKESAKLLYIDTEGQIKRILKEIVEIEIYKSGKPLKMDARLLLSTLKSRIKKLK